MNRTSHILPPILILGYLYSQSLVLYAQDSVRTLALVEVIATRISPHALGATRTQLDSLPLRQDLALSLGDVLSQSSSVFVKSYGRGTMATASFRGTSPAHTEVQWNGMKLNSPSLGQADLSLIPSILIDKVSLWHGASASNVSSGALGGAIVLENSRSKERGHQWELIQSIASYSAYDSYLSYRYGGEILQTSTRLYRTAAKNDFTYRNFSKFLILEDGSASPEYELSTNENAQYADWHALQEIYLQTKSWGTLSAAAWLTLSNRGVPLLQTDQRSSQQQRSYQNERSLRTNLSWKLSFAPRLSILLRLGYATNSQSYLYEANPTQQQFITLLDSKSHSNSLFVVATASYSIGQHWHLRAQTQLTHHSVRSHERISQQGYPADRLELSTLLSARYRPTSHLGFGTNIRGELYGTAIAPPLVSVFAEYTLLPQWDGRLKASAANNYRFPTLNDLYYQPGGNPHLRPEQSLTYDLGFSLTPPIGDTGHLSLSGTLFDSNIKDWILWLPTFKGYWTPKNIRSVHNFGFELKATSQKQFGRWSIAADVNWSYTRAMNMGEPLSELDRSRGKQLPYIPQKQASLLLRLGYRGYALTYKFNYYSERFTTSDNISHTFSHLTPYYMSDLTLEKSFHLVGLRSSLKLSIYNLLNEEYVSVLHRPMPRRNYNLTLSLSRQ